MFFSLEKFIFVSKLYNNVKYRRKTFKMLARTSRSLFKIATRSMATGGEKKPMKFTTSEAHVDYTATRNFYDDDQSLPPSHNYFLAGSSIFGFYYLIFLRDDVDEDGGLGLLKPVHETMPELAIPMLQSAITQNRKLGYNTKKLEERLKEYMKEPEKYGGEKQKLVEN